MSNFEVKQQVRPETDVRLINGLAQGEHGLSSKSTGLVSLYATADLPSATNLEDGILAFDTTVSKLKMTRSGSWVLTS